MINPTPKTYSHHSSPPVDVREVICGRCNAVFYVAVITARAARWHPQFCPFCGIRYEFAHNSIDGEMMVHYPRDLSPTAPPQEPPDVE